MPRVTFMTAAEKSRYTDLAGRAYILLTPEQVAEFGTLSKLYEENFGPDYRSHGWRFGKIQETRDN